MNSSLRLPLLVACTLFAGVFLRAQSNYATPYAFTTVAGDPGYGSVDGTGSAARFHTPTAAAVDASGNLYIADTLNNTIRKITSGGTVTTLAGVAGSPGSADGTGNAARFNKPQGIAVDANGTIYVADTGNHIIRQITAAGVVTTLAGIASTAGSADGTGTAAQFSSPIGISVDNGGVLYVADSGNFTVRKIASGGIVTTFAGHLGTSGSADGTGTAAQFSQLSGVAADHSGNVFVIDANAVRKITSAAAVTTIAGSASTAGSTDATGVNARFNSPRGLAVDGAGMVYVADATNHTIRKITTGGMVTTLAGLAGSLGSADGAGSGARLNFPYGIAVDNGGTLYVADSGNQEIRKITGGGAVTTLAGLSGFGAVDGASTIARFGNPGGVAVDANGNTYVADTANHVIRKISSDGTVSTLAGLAGTSGSSDGTGTGARFNFPNGLAVDSSGNVFVADTGNQTIRRITPAGGVMTFAGTTGQLGSADGTGTAAKFSTPRGVAVDNRDGTVYVADAFNQTIRKITSAQVVTTLAGKTGLPGSADGTGNAAQFNNPYSVTVDAAGNLYVADTFNYTIRKVTSAGVVTTLAGTALTHGSADGVGTAAQFGRPQGVAVDTAGNVYVADAGNYTVRKITSTGTVTTLAGLTGSFGYADGTGADVRFFDVSGVALDSSGALYIADTNNNVIRRGVPTSQPPALPSFTGAANATAQVGQAFTYTATFSGSPNSYSATGLPAGLNFDTSTGMISGTPTAAGTFSITLGAINATGSGTGTLTLVVNASAPAAPSFTGAASATGQVGQAFTYTAAFSNSPTSYSATGLPSGLNFNTSTGLISGAPTAAGTFSITLGAINATGSGSGTLTLVVSASGTPSFTGPATATGQVGQAFSYTAAFSNSPTSYSASGLPGGLNFNTGTGVISGTPTAAGTFSITLGATNATGSGSGTLTLTIVPAGQTLGHLVNLSVRTGAGTGDSTLIVGLVIGGSGTSGAKPVLIRGVGPTLTGFGVSGVLADPNLGFYVLGGTSPIATNDNWGGDAQVIAVANTVGAFALPDSTSKDAAIYLTPSGGAYTVKINGANSTSGIALAEIYDASGTGFTSATPRLINVSARAQVGTGDGVLIAGFVIAGSTPRTVLIRGIGPTLGSFGVGGVLADPQLEVTQLVNGSNVTIATNDNWGGNAQVAVIASTVGAFALPDTTSKDAAVLVTLPPGVYSAKVSGVGSTTGVGLIEIYEAP